MRVMIKSCSRPIHRLLPWKNAQVLVHNQYVEVNQNSLKHYPTPPTYTHHNLQILILPSEFTWPTSPTSLRAEPSQRASSKQSSKASLPPQSHSTLDPRLSPQLPLPPLQVLSTSIPTLIQTSLYASDIINSASSFPRDCHAKSFRC